MSLSPRADRIAVVESGYASPAVAIYDSATLKRLATVHLPDVFGRPVWTGNDHVVVAGASSDAILDVNVPEHTYRRIPLGKKCDPVAVAVSRRRLAAACDGDASVRLGDERSIGTASPIHVEGRLGAIAWDAAGGRVFVSERSGSRIYAIDITSRVVTSLSTRLHPSALLVHRGTLYVAETDADTLALFDARTLAFVSRIFVGVKPDAVGVSPNALFAEYARVYISLGAANAVAVLQDHRLLGFLPAGRYPTDVAAFKGTVFVLNGKGEGSSNNPGYRSHSGNDAQYVASLEAGSLRALSRSSSALHPTLSFALPQPIAAAESSPIRAHGPIQHVFIILKENRSYDEVLGDVAAGRGDPHLAWFGQRITPNEHALASQYGLFDNAFATGEVSAVGHLWMDAAFANDYAERSWPLIYAGRRDDDLTSGDGPRVPLSGYLWETARHAGVSFRDYGELVDRGNRGGPGTTSVRSLRGSYDPGYVGWDLAYSDLAREKEWQREFAAFVRSGTLPQLELIWLPNDHTAGSKPRMPTPAAYVATNDLAVGRFVDAISHSHVWPSSLIFITEDDAQDGPDHIGDQRTVLLTVSPFSHSGTHHDHFSTVNILRTVEIVLGLPALSAYDATAAPMYSAFDGRAVRGVFNAREPTQSLSVANRNDAYAGLLSSTLDFTKPDRVRASTMRDILSGNHGWAPVARVKRRALLPRR